MAKKDKIKETIVQDMVARSADFNSLIEQSYSVPAVRISAVKNTIDVRDTNSITTFGVKAQKAVNSVSDDILKGVKNKDVGPVADSLNQVVLSIRSLDLTKVNDKQGFFSKLFGAAAPIVTFLASYETTISQIDSIMSHLDRNRTDLSRSVARLDILYRETEKYSIDLEVYIAAIKEKMSEFETQVLPIMKQRALDNETPMAGQEYSDAMAIFDRLDRKCINLALTRQVTMQNLPSIRLTQEHDVSLLEKINDIEVNLVPLWKRQLAIALESAKTHDAGAAVDATTDLGNEILVAGAKQLGMAQIEAQKTIERSIIDVNAVKEANDILINTIQTTQAMIVEGRKSRRQAEVALEAAETDLRKAITAY